MPLLLPEIILISRLLTHYHCKALKVNIQCTDTNISVHNHCPAWKPVIWTRKCITMSVVVKYKYRGFIGDMSVEYFYRYQMSMKSILIATRYIELDETSWDMQFLNVPLLYL